MRHIRDQLTPLLTTFLIVAALFRLTACADPSLPSEADDPNQPTTRPEGSRAAATTAAVLVGAADIAHCGSNLGDEKTADLIEDVLADDPDATVFAAGDVVYDDATAQEFANCYDPTWGRFKGRTRPALGNHEYNVSADPYFDYFGAAAGERGKGYYSYDLGDWHIVVLNSNNSKVSTAAGSPQDTWLKNDLASTSKRCVLAYWHHARFRSTVDGTTAPPPYAPVKPFWDALYAEKADVVLVGHQHFYERFAPQTPDGSLDTQGGIRQFVIGMGGKSTGPQPTGIAPNSEVRHGGKQEFGVLKLTLGDGSYSWEYLPVAGKDFHDSGSGTCHPKGGGGGSGSIAPEDGDGQSATVGTAVATPPSVRVVDANGDPAQGVSVTFAVTAGGGSVSGAGQTTGANGIATVGSWTLGTIAGSDNNRLTATAAGLTGSPVTFRASARPGPANAGASTATVPNGVVGSATVVTIRAKDQFGNDLTTGGATVAVSVSGANSASPPVTDQGDGTYRSSYVPAMAGTDQVAITLNSTPIGGSPFASTVSGGGGAGLVIVAYQGDDQTAPAGTVVPIRPTIKVTDGAGNPVAGVKIRWAVSTGGGTASGVKGSTTQGGIERVGSWTLGSSPGANTLTATATGTGITGNPVTFTATGN